jgi:hypothetical protein
MSTIITDFSGSVNTYFRMAQEKTAGATPAVL